MKENAVIFVLSLALIACAGNQTSEKGNEAGTQSKQSFSFNQTLQANGYKFSVKASDGESKTVLLESAGLESEYQEAFTIEGAVKEIMMLDLDNDGHQEFYVLIAPNTDPTSVLLKGFASNQSKTISEITVRDEQLNPRDQGTDTVTAENGQLIRQFSKDQQPFTFNYMLMQSEAGFLLLPRLYTQ